MKGDPICPRAQHKTLIISSLNESSTVTRCGPPDRIQLQPGLRFFNSLINVLIFAAFLVEELSTLVSLDKRRPDLVSMVERQYENGRGLTASASSILRRCALEFLKMALREPAICIHDRKPCHQCGDQWER